MSSVATDIRAPSTLGASRVIPASPTDRIGLALVVLSVLLWAVGLVAGVEISVTCFALLGFAAAVIGIGSPAIGLFGVGILCTMDAPIRYVLMDQGGFLLRWNSFNYWLLIVLVLYAPFVLRVRNAQFVIWQLFLLLLTVQLIYTPDVRSGVLRVLGLISMLSLAVYFTRTLRDARAWYWLGLINGTIGAVGGLVFSVNGTQWITVSANQWARFPLAAIFSACLAMQYASIQRRGQAIVVMLAAVNLGWVFLSGSRGNGLIGIMCFVYLLTKVRGRFTHAQILGAVGLLLLVGASLYPSAIESSFRRFELLFNSTESFRDRTSGRSELMLGGWYMFLENPLGLGTGGFNVAWADLDIQGNMQGFRAGEEFNAHSGATKVLAENGILGILIFGAFVASFLVSGYYKRKQGLFGLAILASMMLAFAAITSEFQGKGLWLFLTGVVVLLHADDMSSALRRSFGSGGRHTSTHLAGNPA